MVRGTTTCSNINCRMKINFINTIFFFTLSTPFFKFTLSTPFKHTVHDDKKIQYYNIIFIRSEVQKHAAIMPVG